MLNALQDFIPSMDGIIDYQRLGSPEALAQELRRLSANDTAYLQKFEWKKHPESWSKSFQSILQGYKTNPVHSQCKLCQVCCY